MAPSNPPEAHTAVGPDLTSLIRHQLALAPPRPEEAVAEITASARLRSRRHLQWSLALLIGGIVIAILLPPSGHRRAINVAYIPCVLAGGAGALWFAMALYYRSHYRVFTQLVTHAPLVTGVVEGLQRTPRGVEYMTVGCRWADGSYTSLRVEGQPFSQLCAVHQELPCLCSPGKYGAVLLPNDELALGISAHTKA